MPPSAKDVQSVIDYHFRAGLIKGLGSFDKKKIPAFEVFEKTIGDALAQIAEAKAEENLDEATLLDLIGAFGLTDQAGSILGIAQTEKQLEELEDIEDLFAAEDEAAQAKAGTPKPIDALGQPEIPSSQTSDLSGQATPADQVEELAPPDEELPDEAIPEPEAQPEPPPQAPDDEAMAPPAVPPQAPAESRTDHDQAVKPKQSAKQSEAHESTPPQSQTKTPPPEINNAVTTGEAPAPTPGMPNQVEPDRQQIIAENEEPEPVEFITEDEPEEETEEEEAEPGREAPEVESKKSESPPEEVPPEEDNVIPLFGREPESQDAFPGQETEKPQTDLERATELEKARQASAPGQLQRGDIDIDRMLKDDKLALDRQTIGDPKKIGYAKVAERIGKKLGERIRNGDIKAFEIAMTLAIMKDAWDIVETMIDGAILSSFLNIGISAALYGILASQSGYIKQVIKKYYYRKVVGAILMEFIPFLSFAPVYTLLILSLKRHADKDLRKHKNLLRMIGLQQRRLHRQKGAEAQTGGKVIPFPGKKSGAGEQIPLAA